MNLPVQPLRLFILGCFSLLLAGCSSPEKLVRGEFSPSSAEASEIVSSIPDYTNSLQSIKGKGRAIVSEPGNTERVTVLFASNRDKSLVTVRSGIGIEGGQLLTDGDTLLVYNKIDEFARKIPIQDGNLDRINRLASLNFLGILTYPVSASDVEAVMESENLYQLRLSTGTEIYVRKESGLVQQVDQPKDSDLPYSKIVYEAYSSTGEYILPRRISIFGSEGESKVVLQLTGLELNPELDSLTINLPDDIRVYYQ